MKLTLFSFFRSSASHRVRIALNLKNVSYDLCHVSLDNGVGDQFSDWYRAVNPHERVPALVIEKDGSRHVLLQSMAIMEWLEEEFPAFPILPRNSIDRARNRAIANIVNADMHPIMNMRVRKFLKSELGLSKQAVDVTYYARWIHDGFSAIEALIPGAPFAFGNQPTFADAFIVPQIENARRFDIDLRAYPKLLAVDAAADLHEAFIRAAPKNQPDFEAARAKS